MKPSQNNTDLSVNEQFRTLLPSLRGDEYAGLEADILAYGCIAPIQVWNGVIVDGHNRYQICQQHGLPFDTFEMQFDSEADARIWILENARNRRNLTPAQRDMMALALQGELAEKAKENQRQSLGRGKKKGFQNSENLIEPIDSIREAAKAFNTSHDSMSKTKLVMESDDEDLKAQLLAGEVSRNEAVRRVKRAQRPQRQDVPSPEGKYRVIYADPPWQYGNKGLDEYGHAERHYPTMSIKELCELPIQELAEDNAVLFLWVTSPMLDVAFDVIKAWGFKYKTSFVWDKIRHNFGHYNSVRHELLLVCTRGSCTPDKKQLFDSVQSVERNNSHSQKPEEFRHIIDTLYTHGGRIELFARERVGGWKTWGNEI